MARFAEHMRSELSAAELGRAAWERRLSAFQREREGSGELAGLVFRDLEQGIAALRGIGLPFEAQSFGMTAGMPPTCPFPTSICCATATTPSGSCTSWAPSAPLSRRCASCWACDRP